MDKKIVTAGLLALAGWLAYEFYVESTSQGDDSETDPTDSAINSGIVGPLQTLYENAVASISPNAWMNAGQGPVYLPTFTAVEQANGIPTNLLARIGYQESRFRQDIIDGLTRSSAGAIGIMQLLPQYFPNAGQNAQADIQTAGEYLAKLYQQFGDWQIAVAAYNDGPGNLEAYLAGTKTLPLETQNYVANVFADVPVTGSLIQVA